MQVSIHSAWIPAEQLGVIVSERNVLFQCFSNGAMSVGNQHQDNTD